MPWVYELSLSTQTPLDTVRSDWQSIADEQIADDLGGVIGSGTHVVVVSEATEPNYGDMKSAYDYVVRVQESHEIPARSDSDFDPPIDLAGGIQLGE